jgi:CRP-like cAMP-binding protein
LEADDFVRTIHPGEVIGEVTFLTGQQRSATVYALEPCECMILKATDLHVQCYEHPSILAKIAQALAERLIRGTEEEVRARAISHPKT